MSRRWRRKYSVYCEDDGSEMTTFIGSGNGETIQNIVRCPDCHRKVIIVLPNLRNTAWDWLKFRFRNFTGIAYE